ncbi:MAG: Sec63 [Pycnora praestabilis]|nr:MAG: Sec63 [Pycnora praestabilis]
MADDIDVLIRELGGETAIQQPRSASIRHTQHHSNTYVPFPHGTARSPPIVLGHSLLEASSPNVYHSHRLLQAPFDASDQELLKPPQLERQWRAANDGARPSFPTKASTMYYRYKLNSLSRVQAGGQQGYPNTYKPAQARRPEDTSLRTNSINYLPPGRPRAFSSSSVDSPSSPSFIASQRRIDQKQLRTQSQASTLDRHESASTQMQISPRPALTVSALCYAPPIVQGIRLVSTNNLPDRFRSVFPFPLFNAIQSMCFDAIYKTDENLVLASPTGSGKTAVLELAICRLIAGFRSNQYKVVYQAPTKSLCSERQRDWQAKFGPLDLQCAELTGDTDQAQLRNVQHASIIITTPEKWDSMTRKWRDHEKLMQLVKLFLIDEVHILKDARGASLEAVVSRMKSVGSDVRFVALSATVPNSDDIAAWLGKDSMTQHSPAHTERFGEEFRPVKLQKFVYGYTSTANDFAFDKVCESKLPDIIAKHSNKKPIMIFCCTRSSAIHTAKALAKLWATKGPRDRHWPSPTLKIGLRDAELSNCATSGVAFHHAGLEGTDRRVIEKAFLDGQINVICCTSTLAIGVNFPCHLVIVKNTVSWQGTACKEYADLEIMQMLGRAGRPQFDHSAVAVIMTRTEKVKHYEIMVSGQEVLESCLHLNLIDHLNAEIGLGTVNDLYSAKRWLAGTFLSVRLQQNPDHYKLEGDTRGGDLDERIEQICNRDIELLQSCNLITTEGRFSSTGFGDAMSRYYIKYETMKIFLALKPKARMSEILSALAQANELHEIRLKSTEKSLYKEINRANGIKFPINVDLALTAHKTSLIIQLELGGVEYPAGEQFQRLKIQFQQDKSIIFSHVHRLIRCFIDCQIYLNDAIATRNALELARSLGARVWDNSPLQLKQISQIGLVAVRKFVAAGINSIEVLEDTEAHRIEAIMTRNPPWGHSLLSKLKEFPRLRVSVKMMGQTTKAGEPVRIKAKAEIAFLNDKIPTIFNRRPIYVCFLAEVSSGHLIEFRRMSARKLSNFYEILFSADLTTHGQYVTCYVMCDDIAGTTRYAELTPDIPASLFPPPIPRVREPVGGPTVMKKDSNVTNMNTARRRSSWAIQSARGLLDHSEDEFGDDGLDDLDLSAAADQMDFKHIDDIDHSSQIETTENTFANRYIQTLGHTATQGLANSAKDQWEPKQLGSGKWSCNHKCKDKTMCKHLCCRKGIDKPPKAPKKNLNVVSSTSQQLSITSSAGLAATKTQLRPPLKKDIDNARNHTHGIEFVDLADAVEHQEITKSEPKDYRGLDFLHDSVEKVPPVDIISQKKLIFSDEWGSRPDLSFLSNGKRRRNNMDDALSDDDDIWMDDVPSPSTLVGDSSSKTNNQACQLLKDPDMTSYEDEISDLEAGMVGLEDSLALSHPHHDLLPLSLAEDSILASSGHNQVRNKLSSPIDNSERPQLPIISKDSAYHTISRKERSLLFTSTDSLSKQDEVSGEPKSSSAKRVLEASKTIETDYQVQLPAPKRARTANEATSVKHALQAKSNLTDREQMDLLLAHKDLDKDALVAKGVAVNLYEVFVEFKDIVDFM